MGTVKYRKVLDLLRDEILAGKYSLRSKFPSVAMIIRRFGISYLTAVKVVEMLKDEGLVRSYQGRGTFVTLIASSRKIGFIAPGIAYSEFFAPILGELSRLTREAGYTLLFGDFSTRDHRLRARQVRDFALNLAKERVAGVIYQPLEFIPNADRANRAIADIFNGAGIATVLISYDIVSPPNRSEYDIVGINNVDAGYRLAQHLLAVGARKIHFLMRPNWSPGICNRQRGVMNAVYAQTNGRCPRTCEVLLAEPDDVAALRRHLRRGRPDAFVCGNDTAAARFKQSLEACGLRVPEDILLAGFDDVKLASLISPPLTTIHQPCEQIAQTAFHRLLERIAHPEGPVLDIFLSAPLVVRASTIGRGKGATS